MTLTLICGTAAVIFLTILKMEVDHSLLVVRNESPWSISFANGLFCTIGAFLLSYSSRPKLLALCDSSNTAHQTINISTTSPFSDFTRIEPESIYTYVGIGMTFIGFGMHCGCDDAVNNLRQRIDKIVSQSSVSSAKLCNGNSRIKQLGMLRRWELHVLLMTAFTVWYIIKINPFAQSTSNSLVHPNSAGHIVLARDDLRGINKIGLGAITSVRMNQFIVSAFIEWHIVAGVEHFILCDENDVSGPYAPKHPLSAYVPSHRIPQVTILVYPPVLWGLPGAERIRKAKQLGLSHRLIETFIGLGDGIPEVEKHRGTPMECKARAFNIFARRKFDWTVLLSPEEMIGLPYQTFLKNSATDESVRIETIGALVIKRRYMAGPYSNTSVYPPLLENSLIALDRPNMKVPVKMIVQMCNVYEVEDKHRFSVSKSSRIVDPFLRPIRSTLLERQIEDSDITRRYDGLYDFSYGLGFISYGLSITAQFTAIAQNPMNVEDKSAHSELDLNFEKWVSMNTLPYKFIGKLQKYYSRVQHKVRISSLLEPLPSTLPFETSDAANHAWIQLSSGQIFDDDRFSEANKNS
eukprot:CFRG3881T1